MNWSELLPYGIPHDDREPLRIERDHFHFYDKGEPRFPRSCRVDDVSMSAVHIGSLCVGCAPALVVQVRTEVWQPACIIDRVLGDERRPVCFHPSPVPALKTNRMHIGPTTFHRTQLTEQHKRACTSVGRSYELSAAQTGELGSLPRRLGLGITVDLSMFCRA